MADDSSETLIVYSDYLCPFCFIGKRSMESFFDSRKETPDVEWRPFDIQGPKRGPDGEIDETIDDGKGEAYFQRVRQNVERLKEEYGVEMAFDLPEGIDSWNAQKVALFVEREYPETFETFHEALFTALWQEGRDIGDPEGLAEIADAHGLPPDEVRAAADDEQLDDELEALFEEAAQRGIRGIPTFIYDGSAAQGAVPPEHLERLVDGSRQ